jgi:hypothetical protein
MARAIARAILGPKKSRPPLKVEILARGHFKGHKKSRPPLKVKIFIDHPFKWAALWVFPHKNNYIQQHLNNKYIGNFMYSFISLFWPKKIPF